MKKHAPSATKAGMEADTTSEPGAEQDSAGRRLAYVEVASSELTRDLNRDLVLDYVRRMQPVSRVEVARHSGLQPSTVSSIVENLLEERWVRESTLVKTARGRRPTLLSLNDDMLFLVADVRPTHSVAAVCDLSGRLLERRVLPLSRNIERSLDLLNETFRQYLTHYAGKSFQGVGISLPGRVDAATGRLLFAPNLSWPDYPLRERMRLALGQDLEVQLENSANASLLAELWFGGSGHHDGNDSTTGLRNAMLVTVSEGIGTAMLADGHLVTGQNGLAGEFGHLTLDPAGPLCGCGARGCWEAFASSHAVLGTYRELAPAAPLCSVLELHALAMQGDAAARSALNRQAHALGQGLHLLNAIASPEVILLAGELPIFEDSFRQILAAECRAGAMDDVGPRLVFAGDGEMARLRGAAAVVLERHAGYYRASHVRL